MSNNDIKIIFGGTVIDGTGSEPIEDIVIIIRGGKITEIIKVGSFLNKRLGFFPFPENEPIHLPR